MASIKTTTFAIAIATAAMSAAVLPSHAGVDDSDQQRQARWQDLAKQIFDGKTPTTDDQAIKLDAPKRAEDAALVPITITLANPKDVKALYLVIDDNPSPVAAHFTFGPDMDPKEIKMRVRVNTYTDMHVVAETKDGKLLETTKFVKASGGCSAPMGMSDEDAMKGMGDMKLKLAGDVSANKPVGRDPDDPPPELQRHADEPGHARVHAGPLHPVDRREVRRQAGVRPGDRHLAGVEPGHQVRPACRRSAKGSLQVAVKDSQNGQWTKSFSVPERLELRPSRCARFLITTVAAALARGRARLDADPAPASSPHQRSRSRKASTRGALHGYVPANPARVRRCSTAPAALDKVMQDKHPVLIDVAEQDRKPPSMSKTMIWLPQHRSIPGTDWMPGAGSGTRDAAFADAFRTRAASLTNGKPSTPIVTFCHPDCWASWNAGKRLVELGYTNVYWFPAGMEGWQDTHDTGVVKPDAAWLASLPKDLTQ